ncbi:MAG: hypothetical protein ACFFCY_15900 [Promethearchaeota archaeon]
MIIKKCPACGITFNYLPNQCENCGYWLIKQKVSFTDNRLRPRYAIELTDKGKNFIHDVINSYFHIATFFDIWNKSRALSSYKNLKLSIGVSNFAKQNNF